MYTCSMCNVLCVVQTVLLAVAYIVYCTKYQVIDNPTAVLLVNDLYMHNVTLHTVTTSRSYEYV